jgi:hypothetical protein
MIRIPNPVDSSDDGKSSDEGTDPHGMTSRHPMSGRSGLKCPHRRIFKKYDPDNCPVRIAG